MFTMKYVYNTYGTIYNEYDHTVHRIVSQGTVNMFTVYIE